MATAISWTNETWNPTTGCSRASDGCRFCYAEKMSLKFGWSKMPWTAANAPENVTLHPERLRKPYTFKKPSRVFVNSMSDLFHPLIPDDYIAEVFKVMNDLPQHTFQVLTKRPERAATWDGPWGRNIWMGTSVEDHRVTHRIAALKQCQALTKFISAEPLIGPLSDVDLTGIDWLIVGGESGQHMSEAERALKQGIDPHTVNPRWMKQEWARDARDICLRDGVAYFYKQDSGLRTELRTYLVHEDGSHWQWHQYPNQFTEPLCIKPASPEPVNTAADTSHLMLVNS